jgi:hypothetical protein
MDCTVSGCTPQHKKLLTQVGTPHIIQKIFAQTTNLRQLNPKVLFDMNARATGSKAKASPRMSPPGTSSEAMTPKKKNKRKMTTKAGKRKMTTKAGKRKMTTKAGKRKMTTKTGTDSEDVRTRYPPRERFTINQSRL